MIKMGIGAAFAETFGFLRANWLQMLLWLGGAVLVVSLLGWLMLRGAMSSIMLSSGDPSAAIGAFGSFILFGLIAGTVVSAASLLIWRSGLVGGEPASDIGWGLGAGAAYMFALFIVYIATIIAMYVVIFIVGLLALAVFGASGLSLESFATGGASGGVIAFAILFYVAIIVFFLWFFGRLSVAGPVMAANRTSNPFSAFAESWRLTGASQWTIVGFNFLMTILLLAFVLLMSTVLGGVAGSAMTPDAGVGTIVGLLVASLLVYVPLILVSVSMPAGIYRAIASRSAPDIFA